MVSKKLSTHLKKMYKPLIEQRDGKNCFYCGNEFHHKLMDIISINKGKNDQVFDHLNDDEEDNRLENLVLAHDLCNQRKGQHQAWINKARQKLRDNERSANIPESHANTFKDTATETDTNAIFMEIALRELAKYLQPNKQGRARKTEILYTPFLDHLTGLGFKQCGHGSQNTMRRVVDTFCTNEFPYKKVKNDQKKTIIRLRSEDEFEDVDF